MELRVPLLDYLAWQTGCEYLSDLHALTPAQRARLRRAVEALPPDAACLREWNDAAAYIADSEPGGSPAQSRQALLAWLG